MLNSRWHAPHQGQEERDRDALHLLRHPRGECGAPGGAAAGGGTGAEESSLSRAKRGDERSSSVRTPG